MDKLNTFAFMLSNEYESEKLIKIIRYIDEHIISLQNDIKKCQALREIAIKRIK